MSAKGAKTAQAAAPAPAAAKPAAPAVDPKVQAAREKLRAKYGDQVVCSFFFIFDMMDVLLNNINGYHDPYTHKHIYVYIYTPYALCAIYIYHFIHASHVLMRNHQITLIFQYLIHHISKCIYIK